MTTLHYQSGFGNEFATEALAGALPEGRNSPQRVAYGLYAEQLSGTAFTAPRADNRRSWLYRIRPAAMHGRFTPYGRAKHFTSAFGNGSSNPNQLRWSPPNAIERSVDFVDGIETYAGNGGTQSSLGMGIHIYRCNMSMTDRAFYNADGEMLVVLQQGRLRFVTELGVIDAEPQEIVVIPRGIRFKVQLLDGEGALHRGYICENFGALLRLPDLGPIGSNGLANPRDFLTPVAAFEENDSSHELIAKFDGALWRADMGHSPLDVVAWHGNYAPYKYDLRRFNTIGSISFDHPDPSIFLVLHSPSDTPGTSNIDFVIFGPRILAMKDTFRPPWFHRNIASEFMGLIHGAYDAKAEGFAPGGASLHNSMTGHGPDAETFEKASSADTTKAHYVEDTMAFMFESRSIIRPTEYALGLHTLQQNYADCWQGIKKNFDPTKK
jgi:homogentisate 1,2-dioxygenase